MTSLQELNVPSREFRNADDETPYLIKPPRESNCECCGLRAATDKNRFFCHRHQTWKTIHFGELCENDDRYFKLWEDGSGPIIEGPTPKIRGIGDLVALITRITGIQRLIRKYKRGVPCGCHGEKGRQGQWNKMFNFIPKLTIHITIQKGK